VSTASHRADEVPEMVAQVGAARTGLLLGPELKKAGEEGTLPDLIGTTASLKRTRFGWSRKSSAANSFGRSGYIRSTRMFRTVRTGSSLRFDGLTWRMLAIRRCIRFTMKAFGKGSLPITGR
jgi:hypothetical protein